MIALKDGNALGRFSERVRAGDLTDAVNQLAALRTDVATRLLKPLDYDPSQLRIRRHPSLAALQTRSFVYARLRPTGDRAEPCLCRHDEGTLHGIDRDGAFGSSPTV